jgi:RHS family protein
MNGKILEEVYDRNAPYRDPIRIPFLFQGQYYDYETGLAYNRFRYYDPEHGRYISQESNGLAESIKLYGYVEDNHVGYDLLGLGKANEGNAPKHGGFHHNRTIDGHIEYPPINGSSARHTFWLIESNGDKITGISTPEKKRT